MSELTGGIRNAMEKKEPLEKIKRSFLNAGYPPEEVQQAIQEATAAIFSSTVQPQTTPQKIIPQTSPAVTNPNTPLPIKQSLPVSPAFQQLPKQQTETKKSHLGLYITLAIVSIVILASSALLGLYWDKIFP